MQKQPDFFDGLMDLADSLSVANEHESAIGYYQRAMKLQPKAVRSRSPGGDACAHSSARRQHQMHTAPGRWGSTTLRYYTGRSDGSRRRSQHTTGWHLPS